MSLDDPAGLPPCPIEIRRLEPEDDRSSFRSGNIDLDRFFQRHAGQNQFRHHIGTTYIACRGSSILGYATVAAAHMERGDVPEGRRKKLPAYPLPVLRLARLAVSAEAQGQGVGRQLLRAVFLLARQMAGDMGCIGVLVDAKPEAIRFYQGLGFVELPMLRGSLGDRPEPTPMFLEIQAITQ